jgi:glycosyltransferase involved in cell wall biosynthesis
VKYLAETLESVLSQDYQNLEVLVLDGGSTDGSLEVISRYEARLSYFRSRVDSGQLDALIEGFGLASGELLGWVNSDDVLFPHAIASVVAECIRHPHAVLAAGNYALIDSMGNVMRCKRHPRNAGWFAKYGVVAVNQPGSLFTRAAYEAVGGLALSPDYVMDTDLYFKLLRYGPYAHVDRWLAGFRIHPLARTISGRDITEATYMNTLAAWSKMWPEVNRVRFARMCFKAWQLFGGNYLRMSVETLRAYRQHWSEWSRRYCPPLSPDSP